MQKFLKHIFLKFNLACKLKMRRKRKEVMMFEMMKKKKNSTPQGEREDFALRNREHGLFIYFKTFQFSCKCLVESSLTKFIFCFIKMTLNYDPVTLLFLTKKNCARNQGLVRYFLWGETFSQKFKITAIIIICMDNPPNRVINSLQKSTLLFFKNRNNLFILGRNCCRGFVFEFGCSFICLLFFFWDTWPPRVVGWQILKRMDKIRRGSNKFWVGENQILI